MASPFRKEQETEPVGLRKFVGTLANLTKSEDGLSAGFEGSLDPNWFYLDKFERESLRTAIGLASCMLGPAARAMIYGGGEITSLGFSAIPMPELEGCLVQGRAYEIEVGALNGEGVEVKDQEGNVFRLRRINEAEAGRVGR